MENRMNGALDLRPSMYKDEIRRTALAVIENPDIAPTFSEPMKFVGPPGTKTDPLRVRAAVTKQRWEMIAAIRGLGFYEGDGDFSIDEGQSDIGPQGEMRCIVTLTWTPRITAHKPTLVEPS